MSKKAINGKTLTESRSLTGECISVRIVNAHEVFGVSQRLKTKLRIKPMRILSGEENAPKAIQLRMVQNGAHEQLRNTAASVLGNDEHIGQVGERCPIRDDASERDLA